MTPLTTEYQSREDIQIVAVPGDSAVDHEIGDVMRYVAHALCSPLWAASSLLESVATEIQPFLSGSQRTFLEHVRGAHGRASEIVAALERFTAVARQTMEVGVVDITALAREVVRSLALQGRIREDDCRVANDLTARGDPALLSLALTLLMENAWQFRSPDRPPVIQIMAWRADSTDNEGTTRTFCIRDNGIGFDPALIGKLFCPFQKLHAEGIEGGIGMGLACVRRIAHRHGGRVWAEGQPDAGASFFLSLPAV